MKLLICAAITSALIASAAVAQVNIRFEETKLPNGLTLILHEDHSAPVVAVVVMYHVGSKNEKVHRTGFAHLFEHMMFQGSEHVADDEHFKLLQEVGANINGSTNTDVTNYFEVVPSNYLELALYLESDRMGFLLSAMTQEKLDNQRDVVKNERRQRVDNVPYGTASERINKAMYPPSHPYSWPVVGYMEDLSAASLDDVKGFFRTYYAPNNAVLSIAGDFSAAEARAMAEKYFGPIPAGGEIERPNPGPQTLAKDSYATYEDHYVAQLPRLYRSWHAAPNFTREDAVLTVLANILSSGKNSRLYSSMVFNQQIAQSVFASANSSEIAGLFQITVTPKPGRNLTEMDAVVDSVVQSVLKTGVTDKEIEKAMNSIESQVVNSAATDLGKANTLANYYCQAGDPSLINKQMEMFKGITPAEVLTVAKKYLTQPSFRLSIVPVGKTELAVGKGAQQ